MKKRFDSFTTQMQILICSVVLLLLGSCIDASQTARSGSLPVPPKSSQDGSVHGPMSIVSVRKLENREKLSFILKNEGEHSIYVSYVPPDKGITTTTFLAYTVERETPEGIFKSYGEPFHFVPRLAPLGPKSAIEFRIIHSPKEAGQYRIMIGYYEDEAVFELLGQKGSNLTDLEKQEVQNKQRVAQSDVFVVQ